MTHLLRRVVFLVPDLFESPGGIARHARSVCAALADCSDAVTVLALHDSPAAVAEAAAAFPSVAFGGYGGRRAAFVRAALAGVRASPTLVLVEHPRFAPLGWPLARLSGAPLVAFAHGIDIWDRLPAGRRLPLRRADRVLCVSRHSARRAIEANGLSPEKVRVLHNCLSSSAEPLPRGRRSAGPSILTVSRLSLLEPYKGHARVIRALPRLLARFPNLVYHVAGDGDARPALQALADECGVAHATRFHGSVTDGQLRRLYADADVFVMPSSGEGFGIVFLEAMAHGVPVVAGNVDATPEVVTEGETGLLVDPASEDELVGAVTTLLDDAGLRERMGLAGARRARDAFGFEQFRSRLLDYLTELDNLAPHGYAA
ncbi:MAG: glycosyltransferase family 4 protein [Chloroflexi bacterium]|nr:glycosyltransferase family 4 protein [Chloroflexota bacterium]